MTSNEQQAEPAQPLTAQSSSGRTARLTPAQEEEAILLAKELLLSGSTGIPTALEALVSLPWNVGVTAITSTWTELNPELQSQLLDSLDELKSDFGKRLRLSLARGLLPIDPGAVERIAINVCTDMRADGAMAARDRQCFANVFVGNGKPWLQHLPIADWKNADPVVACAVDACFSGGAAPFTQVALLRWLAQTGELSKLAEPEIALIAKAARRWNPRFQKELKKEVPELPAPIVEAMTEAPKTATETPAPERLDAPESEEPRTPDSSLERMVASARGERQPASRGARGTAAAFDLTMALRQIEAHVSGLRRELRDAETALRQREGGRRQSRREEPTRGEIAPGDTEALQRHNERLEATVAELRQRLDELAADHEDRAAVMDTHGSDNRAQLTELLGLKLRESYAEFSALRANAADEVVRQHFADMLDTIFRVLEEEGVPLR
ncbi:MAG: hypothetical protein QOD99_1605 [Chthoniobacter sp.]|jgi:hypothetical protein|nr:hypothetical protein [Chthoniobacter sp.]